MKSLIYNLKLKNLIFNNFKIFIEYMIKFVK